MYGIGLDKIDIEAATELGIPVLFTPGVNHTTVAEHCFALLLALVRNLVEEVNFTRSGQWKRLTGHEIMGRKIGIAGLGRIGKEMAIRAKAFGLETLAYDIYWDREFADRHGVKRAESLGEMLNASDIVTLHTNLTPETRNMLDAESIGRMKKGVLVINCARGELVDTGAMVAALISGQVGGYGADVLELEPPPEDHPLFSAPNCLITPHIGSRTYESVVRQATKATKNLILALRGEKPLAQFNDVPIKPGGGG